MRNSDTLSRKIVNELEKAGQNIRKYYQRRLPSNPSKDYYYIMRDTPNIESIIVEYGFLDSSKDDVNQLKNNWDIYAEAVVKALVDYANITYVPPIASNYYVVKSGDSLWSIAKKFNISVDDLKELNKLNSNLLSIGQNLMIPTKESSNNNEFYVVKSGDSLWSISNEFGISVQQLKTINNLKSDLLSIGQKLIVSKNLTNKNEYMVKSGDTLYSIANKYGVSVSDLKSFNNLSNDLLKVGQILKIPNSVKVYVVKKGDTLYSISRMNNVTVSELVDFNNLSTNILSVGQMLMIP